jgi:cyclophilin family peptidyl-prolyl cis-trans isomerase
MTRTRLGTLFCALALSAVLGACTTAGVSAPPASASAPASGGASSASCPTSQPAALPAGQTRTVTITTALGGITIKVEGDLSPIAAGNFVALADCGFYDGVVFHRVVPSFVIQGGDGQFGRATAIDPARIGQGGPGYTIKDEPVTATYRRGVVALARTPDPDTQGSQFFIVLDDSAVTSLAMANNYAIVGSVSNGMDVVDAIAAAAGGQENPSQPVVMTDVSVSQP